MKTNDWVRQISVSLRRTKIGHGKVHIFVAENDWSMCHQMTVNGARERVSYVPKGSICPTCLSKLNERLLRIDNRIAHIRDIIGLNGS